MNTLTLLSIVMMLAAATTLYALSYDTRALEAKVRASERNAERLRSEIAILKAERAYLARPERMEPYARDLGLAPIRREQYADDRPTAAVLATGANRQAP